MSETFTVINTTQRERERERERERIHCKCTMYFTVNFIINLFNIGNVLLCVIYLTLTYLCMLHDITLYIAFAVICGLT